MFSCCLWRWSSQRVYLAGATPKGLPKVQRGKVMSWGSKLSCVELCILAQQGGSLDRRYHHLSGRNFQMFWGICKSWKDRISWYHCFKVWDYYFHASYQITDIDAQQTVHVNMSVRITMIPFAAHLTLMRWILLPLS